jgi:hypothetical protein
MRVNIIGLIRGIPHHRLRGSRVMLDKVEEEGDMVGLMRIAIMGRIMDRGFIARFRLERRLLLENGVRGQREMKRKTGEEDKKVGEGRGEGCIYTLRL